MQSQKTKAPLAASESDEQIALFNWAELLERRYPDLKLMFHIPNGGKRDVKTAKRLKAEGVKPGVPDIELPSPRGGYFGLFIEMKAGKNTPTDYQTEWLAELKKRGYYVAVCHGWQSAAKLVESYLHLKPTETFENKYKLAISVLEICSSGDIYCENCPIYEPCKIEGVNIAEIFERGLEFYNGRFGENV